MPKFNQEKTNNLQEEQARSIESLFGDTKKNTAKHIKDILSEHLGETNNAKYREALGILKYARNNNNIASKLFTENMVKAIKEWDEVGMSQKTISDIINIIYDKKCNYYNTEAKIKALWRIVVDPFGWTNETNLEKQMELWIWWECSMLSTYAYNNFVKKNLIPRIKQETGKDVMLWQYGGSTHEYFVWDNDHQFLYLDIGDDRYVLDPSLGVIANNKNTSYEDDSAGMDTKNNKELSWYANEEMQSYWIWNITLHNDTEKIYCKFDGIPLWFLSDTDLFLWLGFAKTNYGKIIPMIAWTTKDANYGVYFIKDDELRYIYKNEKNSFRHREKNIPKDIHQKIQNILKSLNYSNDIKIREDEDKKEIEDIQSGHIAFFNSLKWTGVINPDDSTKDSIMFNSSSKYVKGGEQVNYIEVNGEAIIVE